MLLNVYTDLHQCSSFETKVKDFSYDIVYLPTVLIGDIVDVAGCKKKEICKALKLRKYYAEILGDCYITGNHEIKPNVKHAVHYDTLFLHGHTVIWPSEKILEWENKQPSSNRIYRFFGGFYSKHFRKYKKEKLNDIQITDLAALALFYGVNTVIMGHLHPQQIQRYTTMKKGKKITLFVLPRGKSIYDTEKKVVNHVCG